MRQRYDEEHLKLLRELVQQNKTQQSSYSSTSANYSTTSANSPLPSPNFPSTAARFTSASASFPSTSIESAPSFQRSLFQPYTESTHNNSYNWQCPESSSNSKSYYFQWSSCNFYLRRNQIFLISCIFSYFFLSTQINYFSF